MHVHILHQADNQTADYQDFIRNFKISIEGFNLDYDLVALDHNLTTGLSLGREDIMIFLAFEIDDSHNLKLLSTYTARGVPRDNIFVVSVSDHVSDLYKNYKYYAFLDQEDRNYWITLLELLYDVKAYIKAQESNRPAIYLATAPAGMVVTRNSIKWELQQHGYRILPEVNLNLVASDRLIAFVHQHIANAIISIHFFNNQYNEPIPELRASIPELEYDVVEDFALKNSNFKYFVWLSMTSEEVANINQKNIIKKIESISLTTNSQIIKGNMHEFNVILHRYLDSIFQAPIEQQIPDVYCIFDGIDKTKFQDSFLQFTSPNSVFSFELVDQIFHDHISRAQHQAYLRDVKTCLIFIDQASERWLYTNLQDIIKSVGIGREAEWEDIYIVYPQAESHKVGGLQAKYPHYYNLFKPIELETFSSEVLAGGEF